MCAKRLTGLEVHQDGVKKANFLEKWIVVASLRWRLLSTRWSYWEKKL